MALFTFSSLLCHAFTVNQLCFLIKKGRMSILILWLLSFFYSPNISFFSCRFFANIVCAVRDGGGYGYVCKRCENTPVFSLVCLQSVNIDN